MKLLRLITGAFVLFFNGVAMSGIQVTTSCWMAQSDQRDIISFQYYDVSVINEDVEFGFVISKELGVISRLSYGGYERLTLENNGFDGARKTWLDITSDGLVGNYVHEIEHSKVFPSSSLIYKKNGGGAEIHYVPVDKKNEHLCPLKPDYRVLREVKPRY